MITQVVETESFLRTDVLLKPGAVLVDGEQNLILATLHPVAMFDDTENLLELFVVLKIKIQHILSFLLMVKHGAAG